MSITLYTGRPGSGKTYMLVQQGIKLLKKGENVYSNVYINWSDEEKSRYNNHPRYWRSLSDLVRIKNGYILLDEAHIYMPSRNWEKLPVDMQYKLSQHRKEGLHIIGTTQSIKRIDTIMRELIDTWYECSTFLGMIIATEYDIDDDQKKRYPLKKKLARLNKKGFARYDTLAIISPNI